MLIAEKFIRSLVKRYGSHAVYTDGGTLYDEAYNVLGLKHYLHSFLEKNLIERVNQYFKDRTEGFDDYYRCLEDECNLFHVYNWIQFFVSMYSSITTTGSLLIKFFYYNAGRFHKPYKRII